MVPIIDLTGKVFYRWKVIGISFSDGFRLYWNCKCSCGSTKAIPGANLKNGESKSCGCFQKEVVSRLMKNQKYTKKHGLNRTPEHRAWISMRRRCYDKNHIGYKYWGGRGITVCGEWKDDFLSFLNYVGKKPDDSYSIDRINNDGNYEPGNVRWATHAEQAINRRSYCRMFDFDGSKFSLTDLSKKFDIQRDCLRYRIRSGWDLNKATSQRPRLRSQRIIEKSGQVLMS